MALTPSEQDLQSDEFRAIIFLFLTRTFNIDRQLRERHRKTVGRDTTLFYYHHDDNHMVQPEDLLLLGNILDYNPRILDVPTAHISAEDFFATCNSQTRWVEQLLTRTNTMCVDAKGNRILLETTCPQLYKCNKCSMYNFKNEMGDSDANILLVNWVRANQFDCVPKPGEQYPSMRLLATWLRARYNVTLDSPLMLIKPILQMLGEGNATIVDGSTILISDKVSFQLRGIDPIKFDDGDVSLLKLNCVGAVTNNSLTYVSPNLPPNLPPLFHLFWTTIQEGGWMAPRGKDAYHHACTTASEWAEAFRQIWFTLTPQLSIVPNTQNPEELKMLTIDKGGDQIPIVEMGSNPLRLYTMSPVSTLLLANETDNQHIEYGFLLHVAYCFTKQIK